MSIANQANDFLEHNEVSDQDSFGIFSTSTDVYSTTLNPLLLNGKPNYMMRLTKLGTIIHVMTDMQRN